MREVALIRSAPPTASGKPTAAFAMSDPAVARALAQGLAVEGLFPSDPVLLRAGSGDFDAVLTMDHDQSRSAMRLMDFNRGVTLIDGFPFLISTPAYGTAYGIEERGQAERLFSGRSVWRGKRWPANPRQFRKWQEAPHLEQ